MINRINRFIYCMFKGIKKINKYFRILLVGVIYYWKFVLFGDL